MISDYEFEKALDREQALDNAREDEVERAITVMVHNILRSDRLVVGFVEWLREGPNAKLINRLLRDYAWEEMGEEE